MRNVKAIALIVAGAILVALPEPATTAVGIALISKGIKMLRAEQKEVNEAKRENANNVAVNVN